MAFEVRNIANAADPQFVNVLGLRALARARTTLQAGAATTDTSLVVVDASMFRVGDKILVGAYDHSDEEERTIASIDLNTSTLTIDALTNTHAAGTRVVTEWHDFGHVRNPSREQDLTELDIQSARLGRLATVKKLTTAQTLEFTFESISVFDRETIAYHTGGVTEAGVIGSGAIAAVEEFTGVMCEFMMVQENAESGGNIKIAYYPYAQVRGDGEESGDGENESALTFRVTVLQDENFKIPAALVATNPAAPFGFRYIVPPANRSAVLDAIAG